MCSSRINFSIGAEAEINWVWQRNIIFLDDYLRADLPMVSESVSAAVRLLLANNPGLTLEEIFGKTCAFGEAARIGITQVYRSTEGTLITGQRRQDANNQKR